MKNILSIAAASALAAFTIVGTGTVMAKGVERADKGCAVHNTGTVCTAEGFCTLKDVVTSCIDFKDYLPLCADSEELLEKLKECGGEHCLTDLIDMICGKPSGGDEQPSDKDENADDNDDNCDCQPDTDIPSDSYPEFNFPEADKPSVDNDAEDAPEHEQPEEERPDIEPPSIKPTPESKPDNGTNNENTNTPSSSGQYSSFISEIVSLVNKERAAYGLSALTATNSALSKAASVRASEQAKLFSHTRPDGSSWTTVLSQNGVLYRSAGENVAYGQISPEEVMNAWMNSSGHRANILGENYTEIGVGVYYKNGTYYWSQLFIS